MEEEEQRHGMGRSTSREGNPSMIWNTYLPGDAQKTEEPTDESDAARCGIKRRSLYLEDDEANFLKSGSCSYTELLHAQMNLSMTSNMAWDTTDQNKAFVTTETPTDTNGGRIEAEKIESMGYQTGAEDPWNVNLFDNMELDKENDEQNYPQQLTFDTEEQRNTNQESERTPTCEKHNVNHDSGQGQEEQFLDEDDIQNFLGNEEEAAKEGNLRNVDSVTKPAVGMKFNSKEEGQEFFNFYSHVAGFSITTVAVKRTNSKKRNNEITQITMKCNKYGKTKEVEAENVVPIRKSTVIAKTDCKVVLVLSEREGNWKVTRVNLDHNHELTPNSRFFRSHKYMSDEEKCLIRILKRTNLETRRIVAVLAYLRGGLALLPYTKKHVTNYAGTINREVSNTDMMEVVRMFNRKQVESPGFYYSFELDEENKVRSIFWADAKSRLMYDICGDCISFDTTFLTNKYNLPFAPFVGVSPHGNTYLFSCAFIVNEKASTFAWLFNQFLTAMGGKHPISVITDQDKAMDATIKEVFTQAVHRICLFHIKKKAEEKAGPCFQANEWLYEDFQDIIDNSLTIEEFETNWTEMIAKYEVQHIKYFSDMWEARQKFVPVYFKDKFFPFIQTTARSEGTNSLFKKGVGAKFSVTSFLREYDRIIDVIQDREQECDHLSRNKKVAHKKFWSKYGIERQAHELYNIGIFRKFQKKIEDTTRLHIMEHEKDKSYLVYQAENYPLKELRKRQYLVQIDLTYEEYSCICCGFQKDGLLCSHILKVMLHLNMEKLPEKYIIDRWRKNDKKIHSTEPPPIVAENSTLRYNVLQRKLVYVASNASKKKRKYEYFLGEIDRIQKRMEEMDEESENEMNVQSGSTRRVTFVTTSLEAEEATSIMNIQDPDVSATKGRPRMLSIREAIKQNKFYKCSHCNSDKHTLKNCPNLDKEYNLPRRKRAKQSNPRNVKKGDKPQKKQRRGEKKESQGRIGMPDAPLQQEEASTTSRGDH